MIESIPTQHGKAIAMPNAITPAGTCIRYFQGRTWYTSLQPQNGPRGRRIVSAIPGTPVAMPGQQVPEFALPFKADYPLHAGRFRIEFDKDGKTYRSEFTWTLSADAQATCDGINRANPSENARVIPA